MLKLSTIHKQIKYEPSSNVAGVVIILKRFYFVIEGSKDFNFNIIYMK